MTTNADRFDFFVLFAEMRTGSNYLEENLNAYPGIKSWGEVFNPHFVAKPNRDELLGVTMDAREENPLQLLDRMQAETDGLSGFRLFHDHDARVIEHCLENPRCAKIVLTRNPLESYVSRKIAGETGQWRLGDMRDARTAQIRFDQDEFNDLLDRLSRFQARIKHALQVSGQTAFYLDYSEIRDVDVLNGMAAFLGVDHKKPKPTTKTKVQNPASLRDKVENFDEMQQALSEIDHFNLSSLPNFEPKRGPNVPRYVAGEKVPLLFMPLKSGPEQSVRDWLTEAEGGALVTGFSQKTLRQWKRQHRGHRSFTVLRHPVARLYTAFCKHILLPGGDQLTEIADLLRSKYNVPLPQGDLPADWDADQHRAAFLGFLGFVGGNLNGQTSVRVPQVWSTQAALIEGMGQFMLPDMILREGAMAGDLAHLAKMVGLKKPPEVQPEPPVGPIALADIYDKDIEAAARNAHQRDYMMFGFGRWKG